MESGLIIKALSGFYYVENESGVYQTRGRGNFRHKQTAPLVGDQVKFTSENDKEGYILEIDERKNQFVRPPLANVDIIFLIISTTEPEISTRLIDRFLVYFEAKSVDIKLIFTKVDLLSEEGMVNYQQTIALYRAIGYDCYTGDEFVALAKKQSDAAGPFADQLMVFAGQSGVGKSTLINRLLPDADIETGEISDALGRGRHTTRHVELLPFANGKVADTPGFSAVTLDEIELVNLDQGFREMQEAKQYCRFRTCQHINEPNCQVKADLAKGQIAETRYNSYLAFHEEISNRKPKY